jgi:hypothetical protein
MIHHLGDSIHIGNCENCGAPIYWEPDETSPYKLREIASEIERAQMRYRVEAVEERERGKIFWMWNEYHKGLVWYQFRFPPAVIVVWIASIIAFLIFDDIKWHALFPVGLAALALFMGWSNHALERDIVRLDDKDS